jgi:CheY-like chemotaxis protein
VPEVNLLLVEDDAVDVKAFKRALLSLKILNPLTVASDGIEALQRLRGENGAERLKRPYLIVLDLDMPRMGGIEFLDELRSDPDLSRSLVFVMTTSTDEENRIRAYDRHVAGYILKHSAVPSLLDAVAMFGDFWRVIELPD